MTSRKWALTLHLPREIAEITVGPQGYPPVFDHLISEFSKSKLNLTYLVGQIETTKDGGYHAQLALTISTPARMTQMKKISQRAHWEIARDWKSLTSYCTKQDTRLAGPWQYGEEPHQGKRSDLEQAARMIQSGSLMPSVAEKHPVVTVRYFKGLQYLQSLQTRDKYAPKKVGLFWGKTGCGKTMTAFEELDDLYNASDIRTPWFDGYTGQDHVLFDECGEGMMHYNKLKQFTDCWRMQAPVKGAMIAWVPKVLILTSQHHLDKWYPNLPKDDYDALTRRIRIFHFPDEKQLAIAWLRGTLIEEPPAKRTQDERVLIPQDSPDDVFAMYGY